MLKHPATMKREVVHALVDRQHTLPNLASDRCAGASSRSCVLDLPSLWFTHSLLACQHRPRLTSMLVLGS